MQGSTYKNIVVSNAKDAVMNSTNAMRKIAELDLAPIKAKLMHKESGEGWSPARADAIEVEYRRFLCMMQMYPHENIAPLVDVDTFWHYHILDTRKYAADCQHAFGHFLHHNPNVGLGEDDAGDHQAFGERMHALYMATFGEACLSGAHAGGTAWCAASDAPGQQATAWCALDQAAAEQATAWCAVAAGAQSTAWCAVAADRQATAWCAVTSARRATAWCAATVVKQAKATAWCAATVTQQAKGTAWCAATVAKQAKSTAWCAVSSRQQATAWCAATSKAVAA